MPSWRPRFDNNTRHPGVIWELSGAFFVADNIGSVVFRRKFGIGRLNSQNSSGTVARERQKCLSRPRKISPQKSRKIIPKVTILWEPKLLQLVTSEEERQSVGNCTADSYTQARASPVGSPVPRLAVAIA